MTSGEQIRDFIYVGDVARFMINFLEKDFSEPINISYGQGYSINHVSKIIKKITKYQGKIIWDKSKPDGQKKRVMDVSKMKRLKFKPIIKLEFGISKTYNWFKKNYFEKTDNIRL